MGKIKRTVAEIAALQIKTVFFFDNSWGIISWI